MPSRNAALLLAFLFLCTIAAPSRAMPVAAFASEGPLFDPVSFYTGQTRSWGIFENRAGEPTRTIRTETSGHIVGGELRMEQDLYFGGQPRQHRSWKMRRLDAHHFEATANDLVGTARGEAYGNAFTWTFTLALKPGNSLYNVQMTQHMYLQPDGKTMINRDTIRKLGFILAEVTEQFRKIR